MLTIRSLDRTTVDKQWGKWRQLTPARYGGRGISICERWRESFENFLDDMGHRPEGCSLDRINNDGNYEPGNVRWANSLSQMNNRSCCHTVTHDGKTQTISEWAREVGIRPTTIHERLKRGWSVGRALTTN